MLKLNNGIRAIAFHLPQYYPIPENDQWWGKGFTEWTNTAKAVPLFKGHYQPKVPADLGFYDLRLAESRSAQAELAAEYGIEGFCYYHYWFAGKQLLQKPVNDILQTGKPEFPFCLCWANETWTGIWHGSPNKVLIEQTYPGLKDQEAHFNLLCEFFLDRRYLKIDGKPVFLVYKPMQIPNVFEYMEYLRTLSIRRGVGELFLIGFSPYLGWNSNEFNFDASVSCRFPQRRPYVPRSKPLKWLRNWLEVKTGKPTIYEYKDIYSGMLDQNIEGVENFPCVVPNWDNTPRSGSNGLVFNNSHPDFFRMQLRLAIHKVNLHPADHKIIFIKSWNEWAEGNYLEPDLKYGRSYLKVIADEITL